jgi:TRAP-type transport system small permease protein
VSWRGEHVVFDTFDRFVSPQWRSVQMRLAHLVCAGLFGLMAWLLTLRAQRFTEYGETTVHLQLPMAPVAWLMAALLALTALAHLVLVFRRPKDDAEVSPESSAM